ncbi:MAG: ABC transporter substrate-binding protein, partial [Candidatus Bathyarchaeota archaeon]|nr:ABC transporter substrate-binding protein [Candidatus Bathyarchaeota archaeon]
MSLRIRNIAMLFIIVAASLAGGLYAGYQRGSADSQLQFSPIVDQLTGKIANVTAENEALRKDLPSIAGRTIKIGYIAPETYPYTSIGIVVPVYSTAKPFIEKVIQPDINAYAQSLGSDVRFEFVVMDAMGQANTHLELVQRLHSMGVDVFIGAGWSSQGCATMAYVNVNKMLMMSPSSTSPSCAVANDRFFRMCPADTAQAPALAHTIWSYGIKELVIIERGDAYGDDVVNLLKPAYNGKGGAIAEPAVRYGYNTTDFADYLQQANTLTEAALASQGGDASRVGVLLLAYDEASLILKQASQYPALYSVTWFGSDSIAKSQVIASDAPLEANHLRLFSLLAREPDSIKYLDLRARFVEATDSEFSIYQAYLYDAALVLAKTIIEIGSDNATDVTYALTGVCENT